MQGKEVRIVFMGTPDFAVAGLKALVNGGYNVVGVITAPDKPAAPLFPRAQNRASAADPRRKPQTPLRAHNRACIPPEHRNRTASCRSTAGENTPRILQASVCPKPPEDSAADPGSNFANNK